MRAPTVEGAELRAPVEARDEGIPTNETLEFAAGRHDYID